ncbi:MAG: glycosyltransferase family 2 protein, partial [Candidatus Bathyarchaeia archaeon]
MPYDLSIALRISPILNSQHIYFTSKYDLVECCFKSFVMALNDIDYELFAILDGCPKYFEKILSKYAEETRLKIIRTKGIGNSATFLLQILILANNASSDYLYFAEDDYFYVGHFRHLLDFMHKNSFVDFVSP